MTSFAGFEYPRQFAILPKGTPKQRLEAQRQLQAKYGKPYKRITGPYYQSEPAPNTDGRMFYMGEHETLGDFMPGLRWKWADKCEDVGRSIDHTGWFCDDFQEDKIRGMVFRLNHGKGFLAGWSMGEGMISSLEYEIYKTEREAAYAADRLAEKHAEADREANEKYYQEQKAEEEAEEKLQEMKDAVAKQLEQAGWV
jgi:hypothetical protein